ncbi:MAG: type I-U CRISPR-associated protein Csb2 [Pirellulaceae bacterium]
MAVLTVGLDFITGRCVAANVSDREQPEWPPHPGRVFMALAAACFETGEDPDQVAALQWLEKLPAPSIHASDFETRSPVKYYVPVNDKMSESKSILQTTPGLTRSKQERSYPTAIPYQTKVRYVWRGAEGAESHFEHLNQICAEVIRVGHSSSLVQAWAELNEEDTLAIENGTCQLWQPTIGRSQYQARIVGEGEFNRLRVACNAERIDQFADLKMTIDSTKGKVQKEAKQVFESIFGEPYKAHLRAPEPAPAVLGLWQGYRADSEESGTVLEGEHFDSDLIVLAIKQDSQHESRSFGLSDSLSLNQCLRKTVMSLLGDQAIPEWVSGHQADGSPSQDPHVAFLTLPFVGHKYSDGHIMGLALALPKQVPPEERGEVLGRLLMNESGEYRSIQLDLGNLGPLQLQLEDRPEPPWTLRTSSWNRESHEWASVTPVVLDKFPKRSRVEDRVAWEEEVRRIVGISCVRAGLPQPIEIDIDTTSWHLGAPRAYPKAKTSRSRGRGDVRSTVGDGFPLMPSRAGKPSRPQTHVLLKFDPPVRGPVLVGAGRFLGYGFCKPLFSRK